MKKKAILAFILILLAVTPFFGARMFKIGTVDVEEVFASYPGVDDVRKKLKDEREAFQGEIDKRKEEIARLEKDYQSADKLSDAEKDRREAEISYKKDLLAEFIDDSNKKLTALKEELTKPIYIKIATVIQRVGAEKGYSIILKKSSDSVLYTDKEIDITKDIVQKLKKELTIDERN